MNTIREQSRNPILVGIAGFVVGMLFGLIVLGWGLWPVQWENATPAELGPGWQEQYLRMTISQFGATGNAAQAQERFAALGEAGQATLEKIAGDPQDLPSELIAGFATQVSAGPVEVAQATLPPGAELTPGALPGTELTPMPGTELTPPPAGAQLTPGGEEPAAEEEGGGSRIVTILIVLICIVLLVIGAGIAYMVFRGRITRTATGASPMSYKDAQEMGRQVGMTDYSAETEPPVAHWQAPYMFGDDLFDVSESIDSPTGEFLGECGVGISDTIGEGDRKKVTAFEVWLFDKNDIQTVTKVLMSTNAFFDTSIRSRLEAKGEPIQAEPEKQFMLETQTLQMVATVKDMEYGSDPTASPQSYFERMIVELAIWQK